MISEKELFNDLEINQTKETYWNHDRDKSSIETAHPDDVNYEGISQRKLNMLHLEYLISLLLTIVQTTFLEEPSFETFRKL